MIQPVQKTLPAYDPRWFVWTIMFLVVTGVSLVTYITLNSGDIEDPGLLVKHRKPSTNLVQNETPVEENLDNATK